MLSYCGSAPFLLVHVLSAGGVPFALWFVVGSMVRPKHTIYVLHRRMLTRGCPTLSGVGKGWGFLLFMPRRLKRYHGRGDLHFITFSCYERRALLGTVCARNLFLKILEQVRRGCVASIVGYVVMPEHVHLLLSEPKKGTLAKLLQVLKQRVSRAMRGGKRRRVSGQLSLAFQSRSQDCDDFGSGDTTT